MLTLLVCGLSYHPLGSASSHPHVRQTASATPSAQALPATSKEQRIAQLEAANVRYELSLEARQEHMNDLLDELAEVEVERKEALMAQEDLMERLQLMEAELSAKSQKLNAATVKVRRLEQLQLIQQRHSTRWIGKATQESVRKAKGVVVPIAQNLSQNAAAKLDAAAEAAESLASRPHRINANIA